MMKKTLITILIITACISCKNETKTGTTDNANTPTSKQDDELVVLKGEFVYYQGAGVLQAQNEVYGIIYNKKVDELNKRLESYKTTETDMIPIEVKGKISTQKSDKIFWDNKLEIVEILNIYEPNKQNETPVIKIQ